MTDEARRRRANLFFDIHKDLPREGPGDAISTRRALRTVLAVSRPARIVDIGCGPGMQTMELASATNARIVALDTHGAFLDRLRLRAAREQVTDRVHPVQASMFALPVPPGSVDVVWAEGSIYIMGFARGLREWRALLRPEGCAAVTHLSWLLADVPDAPRQFWARHFPEMTTVDENVAIARERL